MYEGRTRGKRVKYTYSDDEDIFYSDSTNRRSARNTGANTPAESGPVTTASGRQIRAPPRMIDGDESAAASVQGDFSEPDQEGSVGPSGRPRRSAAAGSANGWEETNGYSPGRRGSMDSEEGATEADFGDDEEDAHVPEESEEEEDEFDADEAMVDEDIEDDPKSLVVKLGVTPPKLRTALSPIDSVPNALPTPDLEEKKPAVEDAAPAPTEVIMKDTPAPEVHPEPQPEAQTENKTEAPAGTQPEQKSEQPAAAAVPASPSLGSGPLAFRGSPEKKHAQPAAFADIMNAP